MHIDKNTIHKIAHLARLEITEKEETSFLNEVNTDNVEPLIHMSEEVNVLREDEVHNNLTHQEALYNAPKKDSDYFRVPKFLG